MTIDIWVDVVCPFCYIGKSHLEQALEQFPHKDEVRVVWHSFELDPTRPVVSEEDQVSLLSKKYGVPREEIMNRNESITGWAKESGLDLHLNSTKPTNSFNAHRLVHLAREHKRDTQMADRLMRAYFTENLSIGDTDVLLRLATEIGLPEAEVKNLLAGDLFTEAVREDEETAHEVGIQGVPFFIFDNTYAVSGAQPVAVFTNTLEKVWSERHASIQQ